MGIYTRALAKSKIKKDFQDILSEHYMSEDDRQQQADIERFERYGDDDGYTAYNYQTHECHSEHYKDNIRRFIRQKKKEGEDWDLVRGTRNYDQIVNFFQVLSRISGLTIDDEIARKRQTLSQLGDDELYDL